MQRICFFLLLCFPTLVFAAASQIPLDKVKIDPRDQASLQRGAKLYVNYCQGCHSLQFMRYNRMAVDLGIVDTDGKAHTHLVKNNLIFTGSKLHEPMLNGMSEEEAARWFGMVPPDLSLITRVRGPNWVYSYLRSFYADASRPWGTNNLVFNDVSMPNVLLELQGEQVPIYRTEVTKAPGGASREVQVLDHLELAKPGSMQPQAFDSAMRDLVNFLAYVAEPVKLERQRIGYWVIGFLIVFLVVVYLLKKEYWKDVKNK